MPRKKKVRNAEFKAKVAIAAVQEQKTAQQLGLLFDVHPTQVQVWKKQLLTGAVSLFETPIGGFLGSHGTDGLHVLGKLPNSTAFGIIQEQRSTHDGFLRNSTMK